MNKNVKKIAKGGISLLILFVLNGSAIANHYVNQNKVYSQQFENVLENKKRETATNGGDRDFNQEVFNNLGDDIDLSSDDRSYTTKEAAAIRKYLTKWKDNIEKNLKTGTDWGIDDKTNAKDSTSKYKKWYEKWKELITSDKQGRFKTLEEYKEIFPIYQFDKLVTSYSWDNSNLKKELNALGVTFTSKGEASGLDTIDKQIKIMEYIALQFFPDFNHDRYLPKILSDYDNPTSKSDDDLFKLWINHTQDQSQLLELFNYDKLKIDNVDEDNWKTSDEYFSYYHQKDIPLSEKKLLEQQRFNEWKNLSTNETLFKKVFTAKVIKVQTLDSSVWKTYKPQSFKDSFKETYFIKKETLKDYYKTDDGQKHYLKNLIEFWLKNKVDDPFDGYVTTSPLPGKSNEQKLLESMLKWFWEKENDPTLVKANQDQVAFKKKIYSLAPSSEDKKTLIKVKEELFNKDTINFITLKQDNEDIEKWTKDEWLAPQPRGRSLIRYLDDVKKVVNKSPLLKGQFDAYKSLLFNQITKEINLDNVPAFKYDLSSKKEELNFNSNGSLLHNHFWNWFKKNFATIYNVFSNSKLEFFNGSWNKIISWESSDEYKKYRNDIDACEKAIKNQKKYTNQDIPKDNLKRFYFTIWAKQNVDALVTYLQATSIKINGVATPQNLLLQFNNDYLIKKYLNSDKVTLKDKLILESYKVKAIDNYLKINLPWKKAPTYSRLDFLNWFKKPDTKNVKFETFNQSNYYISQAKKSGEIDLDGVAWTKHAIDNEYGPLNPIGDRKTYWNFYYPFVDEWITKKFKPKELKPNYKATSFLKSEDIEKYVHIFQNNPVFKAKATEIFNEWIDLDAGRIWLETYRSDTFSGYLNSQEFRDFIFNMITYDITKGGSVEVEKAKIFKSKHPFAQLVGFMIKTARNDLTVTDIPEHNKDERDWEKWEYRAEFINQKTLQAIFNDSKKDLVSTWEKIYDDKYKLVYDFLKEYQFEDKLKTVALWATKEENFAKEAWKIWKEELKKSVKRFYLDDAGRLKNNAIKFFLGGAFLQNKIEKIDFSIDTNEKKHNLSDEELKKLKIEARTKDEIVFIQSLPRVDRSPKNVKNWKIKAGDEFKEDAFHSLLVNKLQTSNLMEELEFIALINQFRAERGKKIATKNDENYYKSAIHIWIESEMSKYVINESNEDEVEKIKEYDKDLESDTNFDKWLDDLSTSVNEESIPYEYYRWEKIYQNLDQKDEFLSKFKDYKKYTIPASGIKPKSYWWDYDFKKVNYQKAKAVNSYLSKKEIATIKEELKQENQAAINQIPLDFKTWYKDEDLLYLDKLMDLFQHGFKDPQSGYYYHWKPYILKGEYDQKCDVDLKNYEKFLKGYGKNWKSYDKDWGGYAKFEKCKKDTTKISYATKRLRFYYYKNANKDLFKKLFGLSTLEIGPTYDQYLGEGIAKWKQDGGKWKQLTSFALPHTNPLQYQWEQFFKSPLGQQQFYQKALPLVVAKMEISFSTSLDLKQDQKSFKAWLVNDKNLKYIKEFFKDEWANELPQINLWLKNHFPKENPWNKSKFEYKVGDISNQEIKEAVILEHNHKKDHDKDFVDESSLNDPNDLLINHIAIWYKKVKQQAQTNSPIYDFYQWWQVHNFNTYLDTKGKEFESKLTTLKKDVEDFKKKTPTPDHYSIHMEMRKKIIETFAPQLSDDSLLKLNKRPKIQLDYWNSQNNKKHNALQNEILKDLVDAVKKTSTFKVYDLYPSDQQLFPYFENWYYLNFEKIVNSVVLHKGAIDDLRGSIYQAWINSSSGKLYEEKIKQLFKKDEKEAIEKKVKWITYYQRKFFDHWFLSGNTKLLYQLFKEWKTLDHQTSAYEEAKEIFNVVNSINLNGDLGKLVVDQYRFTRIYHFINQYKPLFNDKASPQDYKSWLSKNQKSTAGKKFLKNIFTKFGQVKKTN